MGNPQRPEGLCALARNANALEMKAAELEHGGSHRVR